MTPEPQWIDPRQVADACQWLERAYASCQAPPAGSPASDGPYLPTPQPPGFVAFPQDAGERIARDLRAEERERRAYLARRRELRGYRSLTRRTDVSHRPGRSLR